MATLRFGEFLMSFRDLIFATTVVNQGELIHADRHGAVVIPDTVIPNLKSSIEKVFASEAIILGPARQPGFDIHKLEVAWAEFEKART